MHPVHYSQTSFAEYSAAKVEKTCDARRGQCLTGTINLCGPKGLGRGRLSSLEVFFFFFFSTNLVDKSRGYVLKADTVATGRVCLETRRPDVRVARGGKKKSRSKIVYGLITPNNSSQ